MFAVKSIIFIIVIEGTSDIIIKRSEETKTGNKKPKIIDTIVSFIKITNENK